MRIGLQSMEVFQRIIFLGKREGGTVGNVGEGLIHHHDDVHRLTGCTVCLRIVPIFRVAPAEALRLVHGVGGELVAEAVREAQFVEHRGNIIGVSDVERVVEVVGGVDCQNQHHQQYEAGNGAQETAQPAPKFGNGEGFAADKNTQSDQEQCRDRHHGNDTHGEVDVISSHGAADFLQKAEVPGEHRLVPYFQLDAVGNGQGADAEIHQRRAEKDVAEQAGGDQKQKTDRHGVQHDQQGLGLKVGQHHPQRVGLAPQGQQRDTSRQQDRCQQSQRQGKAVPLKTFQCGNSFQRKSR